MDDEGNGTGSPVKTVDPQVLAQGLRDWVGYLREMGVYDLYRRNDGSDAVTLLPTMREALLVRAHTAGQPGAASSAAGVDRKSALRPVPSGPIPRGRTPQGVPPAAAPPAQTAVAAGRRAPSKFLKPEAGSEPQRAYFTMEEEGTPALPPELAAPMPKPNPLEMLLPRPAETIAPAQKAEALRQLQAEIGDCTRCPLAYAGRHTIVFGEGDPDAALMFIGEGPGADEDASGRPFVGKAGQLLENMIGAMGLRREQVYIANIVKCRPPGNRAPEFAEATTCSQFLLRQIDIVQPRVIVALGATAATYVLGVRQSLASLRGEWFQARDAKVAVTYHPAFLLRDPRQKGEAWKDLQRVMAELGLQAPARGV